MKTEINGPLELKILIPILDPTRTSFGCGCEGSDGAGAGGSCKCGTVNGSGAGQTQ